LQILALFVLWKIRCKYIFDHEVSLFSNFCSMWRDEVHHWLLAKGTMLIKDAQYLDPIEYFDFISTLVGLRKRLLCSLYILFHFYTSFCMSFLVNIRHI
jgi:hypothetical protein